MNQETKPDVLRVIARSPFNVYFEGEASSLSAKNKVGPFDILPGHADFFSILRPGDIKIETETDEIKFPITNGIITVRDNEILLFVDM